jgi:hypothetical protein
MSVPSVLLELTVERQPSRADEMPGTDKVAMELSRETLETLLDGLGKIRDQLNTMK